MTKSLLYGPVTSRRLGLSLGVDLVPYKTCSFDCIYCQIGRTTHTTVGRRDFGVAEAVLRALQQKLQVGVRADHITLGGSGEPTLNLEIGHIIRGIKKMTDIPVAVLTNGSMLWDPDVRDALAAADIVLPSLDAADEETFRQINRPHPDISFNRLVEGIISFSRGFKGQIWLEIFLVDHFNTAEAHLEKFKKLVAAIAPDRVHLNTAVRPAAEAFVGAVDNAALMSIAARIGHNAEVIADFKAPRDDVSVTGDLFEQDVVDMLLRRPCTVNDIAAVLNVDPDRVAALLEPLVADGRVKRRLSGERTYYWCTDKSNASSHSLVTPCKP